MYHTVRKRRRRSGKKTKVWKEDEGLERHELDRDRIRSESPIDAWQDQDESAV